MSTPTHLERPVAALAACLALLGCTQETERPTTTQEESTQPTATTPPSPSPSSSSRPSRPKQRQEPRVTVTSCEDLLDSGWAPPPGEPQLGYDPESGQATMSFDERPNLVVDLLDDPACKRLPVYGPILERTLRQVAADSR